ncbi:MAG: hypothetical protein ABI564_02795 [Ideonella sp.]
MLAAVGLVICLVLMIRLGLPKLQQRRFDGGVRRAWFSARTKALQVWRWRGQRAEAQRVARDAIDRASGRGSGGAARPKADGAWQGNVYKPKSFRKPRKPH